MLRLFCLSIPQTSIKVNTVMRNITQVYVFSGPVSHDFAARRSRHGSAPPQGTKWPSLQALPVRHLDSQR